MRQNIKSVVCFCALILSLRNTTATKIDEVVTESPAPKFLASLTAPSESQPLVKDNTEQAIIVPESLEAQLRHQPDHGNEHQHHFEQAPSLNPGGPIEHNSFHPWQSPTPYASSFQSNSQPGYSDQQFPVSYNLPGNSAGPLSFKTGITSYFDPGFDVQATGDQVLNFALTVALGLFALSVIIPIIGRIAGLKLRILQTFLEERSIKDMFTKVDREKVDRYTDLASRAIKLYTDMNKQKN